MKILTSPAKLMDISRKPAFLKPTIPHFIDEAATLQQHLREKDPLWLANLMEISVKLADENWQRNQQWKPDPAAGESAPALFAFTGEVYRGLDAPTLDQSAINYLQKHYRILSGLYGLLRPSDNIMLYRLEMGRKFQFDHYKNLYDFWREKITAQLKTELAGDKFVLNLASAEYVKAVDRKKLAVPVVDVDFFEFKDGGLKTIVVYTKHARGMMVRHCAETRAKTLNDVKSFSAGGYRIDEELSTPVKLVFVR